MTRSGTPRAEGWGRTRQSAWSAPRKARLVPASRAAWAASRSATGQYSSLAVGGEGRVGRRGRGAGIMGGGGGGRRGGGPPAWGLGGPWAAVPADAVERPADVGRGGQVDRHVERVAGRERDARAVALDLVRPGGVGERPAA